MEALPISRHHSQSRRSLLAVLLHCLPLLLCILAVQINISKSQESSAVSESGAISCTNNEQCSIGFRCSVAHGVCVRKTCKRDCSNATGGSVCGKMVVSEVLQTYDNLCELRNSECEADEEIEVVAHAPCDTLAPPKVHYCENQKTALITYIVSQQDAYIAKCLDIQSTNNVPIEVLQSCSMPTCTADGYAIKQCHLYWCWCSTVDGIAIDDTLMLSQDMPDNYCAMRSGCPGGHKDGDVFIAPSGCGFCECLNGVSTCFEDFVPNSNGKLNTTQVAQLKDELIQIFFFQYNHDKHVLIDIRKFHKNPTEISDSQESRILEWKFIYYDMNGNGELSHSEEHIFQMELYQYVKCKLFFNHVTDVIDTNGDGTISEDEWYQFFEMEHTSADLGSSSASGTQTLEAAQPQRRNVAQRKPLESRTKFRYVLQ